MLREPLIVQDMFQTITKPHELYWCDQEIETDTSYNKGSQVASLVYTVLLSHHDGIVSSLYMNRTKVITLAVAGTLRQPLATKEKVKTLTFLLFILHVKIALLDH